MRGFVRGIFAIAFLVAYFIGLVVWSPLFLFWPRSYEGMSYGQTVGTRWVLVRHIWKTVTRPMR